MDFSYIIKEDYNYDHLSEEDKIIILKKAVEISNRASEKYDTKKIKEYLKNRNFEIINTSNNSKYKYRARIDINKKTKAIYIYQDMLKEDSEKYDLPVSDLKNLYIAHEFFHLLEYDKIINLDYYVSKKFLKIFSRKVKIMSISEIGANNFASKVSSIDVTVMDKE